MAYPTSTSDRLKEMDLRFGTEMAPVTVRGRTLQIMQIKDLEPLLNKQFAQDDPLENFPFWAKIWEAAIILAHHLAGIPPEADKEMLEIGAGLGVAGLFAAAFGHSVTITDYEEDALAFALASARINQIENVRVQKLDWCSPNLFKKYHYIIGSEILFNEKFSIPLFELLEGALAPGGLVYLAHDRSRMSPGRFFGLIEGHFKIESKLSRMKSQDEGFEIVIHRLSRQDGLNAVGIAGRKE